MRAYLVVAAAVALVGCGSAAMPQKVGNTAASVAPPSPGRVVVYRNGVAYVERFADVENGTLSLAVPRDKVDDLLKSLSAVDVATGEPVPVSYAPGSEADGVITLQVGTPAGKSARPVKQRLRLTYVTGAPAWKPSYRVVVGKTGEVSLEGWAIVDNASGEDWKDVRLGVGASSAMSFRFDLKGLRNVERDTLDDQNQFAQSARGPAAKTKAEDRAAAASAPSTEPIGTSHFESTSPMSVPKGTSAMVSILRTPTEGEVVYLYDPRNPKADARFPLRTIRFRNPSDGALESGPLSVFGDGRFVGEGLAEQVPARSIAFVPFAQDRQIVVERKQTNRNEIARVVGLNHGVLDAELKHTEKHTYSFTNRMGEKATVYLKHTVTPGFKLAKFPDTRTPAPGANDASDHLADASLFKVELEPNGHVDVEIEEAVPQRRTTDIRSPGELELLRAFLQSDAAPAGLKERIDRLLEVSGAMAKTEDKINVEQQQIDEARTRIEEIKAQLAALKSVKSGSALAATLEKKQAELVQKVAKQTVELVADQDKLAVAQIELQTAVAETTLEGSSSLANAPPPAPPMNNIARPAPLSRSPVMKHPVMRNAPLETQAFVR